MKKNNHRTVKLFGVISLPLIGWGIVITIAVIWLISQQIKINEYQAEIADLKKEEDISKERISELETMTAMSRSDEYIEREARKRGYVLYDEVIFKEAN